MRKLFLSSFFKDVASLLEGFAGEAVRGKTVTFIPTAGNVEWWPYYIGLARKAFRKIGVKVDELDVSKATREEIADKLQRNDYIYVSGGNTPYLLQELRKSGADKMIAEQIEAGKLYIGESAGSVIVAPDIEYVTSVDKPGKAPELTGFAGLNIVDFYPVPHRGNFPFAGAMEKIISQYQHLNLLPYSNNQVVLVEGEEVRVEER